MSSAALALPSQEEAEAAAREGVGIGFDAESSAAKLTRACRPLFHVHFRPKPKLTVTEWADSYRVLSPESSFRAGQFSSDAAPYQKEPMEVCGDPRFPRVVIMFGSQLGKTETLNNVVGYFIDQDPSPIMVVNPTEKMAETWSKDRLSPMIRDTPRLRNKVREARSRDSGNTILHKQFEGGHITMVGPTPANLAARPIRVLLFDEVDRYPPTTPEGEPMSIAEARTRTFPNRKIIKVSSPTIEEGNIGRAWEASDQRWYWIPCPHCGTEQRLEFGDKDTPFGLKWEDGRPDTVEYVCKACAAAISEKEKPRMLARGRWIAENPGSRIPGFRLSALYSPFYRWESLVEQWLLDKKDPQKLQAFVNTMLCEFWVEFGEVVDAHILASHMSEFPRKPSPDDPDVPIPLVPNGVGALMRAVDVQADRLEVAVWGFGREQEAWRVDMQIIAGDPATPGPWAELARMLPRPYEHESGAIVPVTRTFIDSGGHHTSQVYDFARKHRHKQVYAIKGASLQEGVPLISPPKHLKSARVILYSVGSFTGKEALMKRLLRVQTPGPFYIHLPSDIDREHLDQFMNEKLSRKFVAGRPVRFWERTGANEQIDLYVYALAALHSLPQMMDGLGKRAEEYSAWKPPTVTPIATDRFAAIRRQGPKRGGGYVDGWKR